MDGQRVVLIHDASGGVSLKAMRWILDGFLLKDGDVFTFVSVVHQILHPMGYKIRVDNSMFGGANQKAIDDEVATKKKEYDHKLHEILKLCEMRKVEFKIEVVVGPIPKNVALDASKRCNATWVILDRRMKKDQKYFFKNLSCGISRVRRNENIIDIRGPSRNQQTSHKMLPVDNKIATRDGEAHNDQDLFSIEFESSCMSPTSTRTSISDGMLTTGYNQDDKINELSTLIEEERENSISNQVETLVMLDEEVMVDEKVDEKKCRNEEVKGTVENIGQSQLPWYEEVNYLFGGMSPVPKEAKHFYQGV